MLILKLEYQPLDFDFASSCVKNCAVCRHTAAGSGAAEETSAGAGQHLPCAKPLNSTAEPSSETGKTLGKKQNSQAERGGGGNKRLRNN